MRIQIRQMRRIYGFPKKRQRKILKDIDITINKGETVLILAPSGCGKTTLINCIMNRVNFCGEIDTGLEEQNSAYIQQGDVLNGNEKVYDCLFHTFRMATQGAPGDECDKITVKALQKLGIYKVRNNKINNISGGQRKRVQVLHELFKKKQTLIIDEADSGLDVFSSYLLLKQLNAIIRDFHSIGIFISHNALPENIALFDKVLILAADTQGIASVAYYGSPQNIYEYFGEQSMLRIMEDITSSEGQGKGMGEYFINKYKALSEKDKEHM